MAALHTPRHDTGQTQEDTDVSETGDQHSAIILVINYIPVGDLIAKQANAYYILVTEMSKWNP